MDLKKRVLFICNPRLGAFSMRARATIYKEKFLEKKWIVDYVCTELPRREVDGNCQFVNRTDIVQRCKNSDIVILIKVNDLNLIKEIKKESQAVIIFDFIDALWRPLFKLTGWRSINEILTICDKVLCENNFIARYALKYNSNVYKTRFCLPLEKIDEAFINKVKVDSDIVKLGWVGSTGTAGALRKLKEPIKNIKEKYNNFELIILGARTKDVNLMFEGIPCTVIENYDEDIMIRELMKIDIGLFPPPSDILDYQLRGANKGMIYMGARIPTIFQSEGECLNFVVDGFNGFLASSKDEWVEKIEKLIASNRLRERVGENGYLTVKNQYCLDSAFTDLEKVLLDDAEKVVLKKDTNTNFFSIVKFGISGWIEVYKLIFRKFFR